MKTLFFLFLALLLASSQLVGQEQPLSTDISEINGRSQYLSCLGEGSPTIIIDAGMGEWSLHWLGVQAQLGEVTRTCVYDRAGYGYSEMSDVPRDAQNIVDELHTLLMTREIEPPYVLLGHSLGGVHMRVFAHQYPDETTALVLVDSPNAEHVLPKEVRQFMEESYAQFPELAEIAAQGFMQAEQMPVPPYMPDELALQYQEQIATESFFATLYGEYVALDKSMEQIADLNDFGDLPILVIAAGLPDDLLPAELMEVTATEHFLSWLPGQHSLTDLSSNSQIIIAEDSRHHIQFDQPDIIVDAVTAIIDELR